jgi:hypothetical protein
LQNLLDAGDCCLLFDGLDEVPTDTGRAAVSCLLEECVKRFHKNRYAVTSRVRAYTGDTILKGEFNRCDIQPFDANDRAHFLKNWVGLLFKIPPEQVLEEGTEASREFQSLTKGIELNDRIRPLALNPLLLTVIAIVHWNRKRLPEQRVDLYDECVDVLLGQRKEAERVQLGHKIGHLNEQQELEQFEERAWLRKRFAEIALHILSGTSNRDEAAKAEIVKLLAPRFIDRGASSQEQAEARATLFLERQELRNGLLVSRNEQSYRFVHLTFQEYLAAWHLANQEFDQIASIVKTRIRQQRWFETLQLLGCEWAKQSDEKLDRYLVWLLEHQGSSIAERAPVIALCANIIKDTTGVAELKPQTRKDFRSGVEGTLDAFRPGSGIPALIQIEILEALGRLGGAVKPHLVDATKSGLFQVRRRAIEMLLPHLSDDELFKMDHILKDRSKEPIKAYILALVGRDPHRTAMFLESFPRFAEKATEAFVELRYTLEPVFGSDAMVAIARRFFEVGKSFRTDSFRYSSKFWSWIWEYEPLYASRASLLRYIDDADLTTTAISADPEGAVRLAALQHLARTSKVDQKYWALTLTIATEDKDPKMRSGVLNLLVTNYSSVSATWPLLRRAAVSDQDSTVRIIALELLVNRMEDAAEVAELFREVLLSVKDSYLFGRMFHAISCAIVENPLERQLLTRDFGYYGPYIDPNEPITLQKVKTAASKLRQSEAEMYAHYENLARTLSSKLGFELKLDWSTASKE